MVSLPSPSDLIYFIEISSTLNLSRTGKRIGISQPSLTQAIKRLEQTIGTALFIRSKNGVALTPAGKHLLYHANALLKLWDTVKTESLASSHEVQGKFTLGVHPSVALHMLSNFLPRLLIDYPGVEIQLKHDLSRKITEGINNFSIDIGLIVNPVRHGDLIIRKLYDDKVTFWRAKEKNANQQIDTHKGVLIFDPDLIQTQWLLKQIHKRGIKKYRLLTSNNLEVITNLTVNGAGIGVIPTSIARACSGMLNPVPEMPSYQDEICLVYRNENRNIKALQTLIHAIKTCFIN